MISFSFSSSLFIGTLFSHAHSKGSPLRISKVRFKSKNSSNELKGYPWQRTEYDFFSPPKLFLASYKLLFKRHIC